MSAGVGAYETRKIGVPAGDLGPGTLHHQPMQIAHVAFGQHSCLGPKRAHIAYGIVVIERLQAVFQRLAADTLLDDQRGLYRTEGIAFDLRWMCR